tara:strand:+ start:407 stop:1012 length:606 start_codon:yes stop_codon:yes gene_type:complete
MHQHIDSWKHSEESFKQQLSRNIHELQNGFPPHWVHFMEYARSLKVPRIVDIGCGAGVYCRIATLMEIDYIGYDYSQHAVDMATQTWNGNFICKNYSEIVPTDIKADDLIVANALCDVLPNGGQCLEHLLNLQGNNLLIQRVSLTKKPEFFEEYKAYNIMTYKFHHNYQKTLDIIDDTGYNVQIHHLYDNTFDLEIGRNHA